MIPKGKLHRSMIPHYQRYYKACCENLTALDYIIESVAKHFKVQIQYEVFSVMGGPPPISFFPEKHGVDCYETNDVNMAESNDGLSDVVNSSEAEHDDEHDNDGHDNDGHDNDEHDNDKRDNDERDVSHVEVQDLMEQQEVTQDVCLNVNVEEQDLMEQEEVTQDVSVNIENENPNTLVNDETIEPITPNQCKIIQFTHEKSVVLHKQTGVGKNFVIEYEDQQKLLNTLELMQNEFNHTEIKIPELLSQKMDIKQVRSHFEKIVTMFTLNENQIFYKKVKKVLLCLTYYQQWESLMANDYFTYRTLKLELTDKQLNKHNYINTIGSRFNILCKTYGMSSLSLLSIVPFSKIGKCSNSDFRILFEHDIFKLVGHKKVNSYIENFEHNLIG